MSFANRITNLILLTEKEIFKSNLGLMKLKLNCKVLSKKPFYIHWYAVGKNATMFYNAVEVGKSYYFTGELRNDNTETMIRQGGTTVIQNFVVPMLTAVELVTYIHNEPTMPTDFEEINKQIIDNCLKKS